MAAYGLYTHIRSNRRRSVLLLAGLFFLVYVLVFAAALFAESFGSDAPLDWLLRAAAADLVTAAPVATIVTGIWLLIAYRFHQGMIDAITGGRLITRRDDPRLYNLLENLCISRGITMPALKMIDTPELNAYATGLNEKQYAITVTRGLAERLDDAEIEAVLAHELTHIRNGDVRMLVIALVIAGVISFFGELVFRMVFQSGMRWGGGRSGGSNRKGGGAGVAIIIALALVVLAWVLSVVIRFALSRRREFLADAGAVELTKNPDAMITALRKIEGRSELPMANSAIMEMCVDNPRSGFADLFSTHPSIQSRVAALVEFAGGHDPGPIALPEPEAAGADPEFSGPWGESTPDAPAGAEAPALPPADDSAGPATGSVAPPRPGPWG